MKSAIYRGLLTHRRQQPAHGFAYRLHYLYLDLDELPQLFRPFRLWSANRRNLVEVRRSDFYGDPERPLIDCVRDRVERELGRSIGGAIRLLGHPRYLGYCFNPVSFYYCFDPEERLQAVLAEITNTPWGERHAYVVDCASGRVSEFDKTFHVSPFFGLDQRYRWSFSEPGDRLEVAMQNFHHDRLVFRARLVADRLELDAGNLSRLLLRDPWVSARGHLAIYWQAFRLWAKRAPFHPHPGSAGGPKPRGLEDAP